MSLLFTDTIVIVRAATMTDRYGDDVPDWDNATRTTVSGVSVQPLRSDEVSDGVRDSTNTTWTGRTPMDGGDLDILPADRVEYASRTLQVLGEPRRWPSLLTDTVSKVEWTMREVVG